MVRTTQNRYTESKQRAARKSLALTFIHEVAMGKAVPSGALLNVVAKVCAKCAKALRAEVSRTAAQALGAEPGWF